jgi:hypothetical protein
MIPKVGNVLRRVREEGPTIAMRYAACRLTSRYLVWRWGLRQALTAADVYLDSTQLGHNSSSCGCHIGTGEGQFAGFCKAMRQFVRPRPGEVLLDYGSGSGKAMIMAATFPFAKIIGVEYSPGLNELATRVLALARPRLRCQQFELVTGDAAEYVVRADVSVVYFFNAFWGDVLERTLDNLRRSLVASPRDLRILCLRPENLDKAAASKPWLIRTGELSYPDTHPDYPFCCYRCDLGALSARA